MKRAENIPTGARFTYLTHIKELPATKGIRWSLVKCDCGTEKQVRSANLRNDSIKSCGCKRADGGVARRSVPALNDAFGGWTFIGDEQSIGGQMYGQFSCKCGSVKTLLIRSVRRGASTSCGCDRVPSVKHGGCGSYLYDLWKRIKGRCHNKKSTDYKNYGGRGITVFELWRSDFPVFERYITQALGDKPSDIHSLDRINNELGYQPGNLRWATHDQQANNRRNSHVIQYHGQQMTLTQLSRLCGISYETLHSRIIVQHWSIERSAETPTQRIQKT